MLMLIGLGLDSWEITVKGLRALKTANEVFYEEYTNQIAADYIAELERETALKFKKLDRSALEEGAGALIELSRNKNVALLISGDPLSATTHVSLFVDCAKADVKTEVYHAPSIFTEVADTGLQLYKFGRTVTLSSKGESSTIGYIRKNLEAGLHTLVLLEPGLDPHLAIETLSKAGFGKLVVVARLGAGDSKIAYGGAESLEMLDFGSPPHSIVVPGPLHFMEKEILDGFEA